MSRVPIDETAGGFPLPPVPTIGEVEQRIMRCDDELAQAVNDLYDWEDRAANAKADWEQHLHTQLVLIADELAAKDQKSDATYREGVAKGRLNADGVSGHDLYRAYKAMEGGARSVGKHVSALQTRMSGLQTVHAGIRGVT